MKWIISLLLFTLHSPALGDSPTAVSDPMGFRESITEENLRSRGFDPTRFEIEMPLHERLQFKHETIRAGSQGTFSVGSAERNIDSIQLNLNSKGIASFTRDSAETRGANGFTLSKSSHTTSSISQGFGGGSSTGMLSFSREEDFSKDSLGFRKSTKDESLLKLGIEGFDFVSSLVRENILGAKQSSSENFDLAISRGGTTLAEFHEQDSSVNGAKTHLRAMTFRMPTIELNGMASLNAEHSMIDHSVKGTTDVTSIKLNATPRDDTIISASHVITERSIGPSTEITSFAMTATPRDDLSIRTNFVEMTSEAGTDQTSEIHVSSKPADDVTLDISHVDSERANTPDTAVTTVQSTITALPDTTVSTSFRDVETEGAGISTQRSISVTRSPTDSIPVGMKASYTTLGQSKADIDPTIDLEVLFDPNETLSITGMYHDEQSRANPELGLSMDVNVLDAKIDISIHERSYDAKRKITVQQRTIDIGVQRKISWGFDGRIGYHVDDSLSSPIKSDRIQISLHGENNTVGVLDLGFEFGTIHTAGTSSPNTSSISVGVSRPIGTAEVSLNAKRTNPMNGRRLDEVNLDVSTDW